MNFAQHLIIFFALCFLLSCSTQNNTKSNTQTNTRLEEKHLAAEIATITNPKMAALLQDSLNTNPAENILESMRRVLKNINEPEALFNLAQRHNQNTKTNNQNEKSNNQNAKPTKNRHERELAILYFNKVLELVPGNQVVIGELYNIYYDDTFHNRHADSFTNAKQVFLQLPESTRASMNPPSLAKYVATSFFQDEKKQPNRQALRELLLEAIQEQPKNDNAYIQLAKLYKEDRYFALAIATLKRGAEHINDSVALYTSIGSTYSERAELYGCSYENPKDIIKSAQYYQLAITLNPKDQALHYSFANTLFDLNKHHLGLHEANILLELNPSAGHLTASAQFYSILGKHKKANELLAQATQKKLELSDASIHEISMNQGDWKTAFETFSSYIKPRKNYSIYDLIKGDIISQQLLKQSQTQNFNVSPPSHALLLQAEKELAFGNAWEKSLYSYWMSKITSEDLKKLALTRCEKTEYFFYTGYRDYALGLTTQAKDKFTAAINQNTYRFIERPLARYFLEQ
jgi:hypothetical protein